MKSARKDEELPLKHESSMSHTSDMDGKTGDKASRNTPNDAN